MAQKFVRVRLENGTEKSVPEVVAEVNGYKPLKKPTHGRDGRLLPPKHRVPLGGEQPVIRPGELLDRPGVR